MRRLPPSGVTVLVAIAVAVAGFASSATTAAAKTLQGLNVGYGSVDPTTAALYVAKDRGYFAREGLNVKITVAGTTAIQELVSGQIDLMSNGVANAATLIDEGHPTQIIWNLLGGGAGAFMGVAPSVKSFADCKSFGTFGSGSAAEDWAYVLRKLYKSNVPVTIESSFPQTATDVSIGQLTCGMGSYQIFAPFLSNGIGNGTVKLLVNPMVKKTLPTGFPTDITESDPMGLTSHLKAIKGKVVEFIRAMMLARDWMHTASAQAITALLKESPDYLALTSAAVQESVQVYKGHFWFPCDGYIPKNSWTDERQWLSAGAQGYDPATDPKYSYKAMVNMSYYDAAAQGFKTKVKTPSCLVTKKTSK